MNDVRSKTPDHHDDQVQKPLMADDDETALDDSTPGDAPSDGSPDSGANAETQDAVHKALIEVWMVLG